MIFVCKDFKSQFGLSKSNKWEDRHARDQQVTESEQNGALPKYTNPEDII